MAPEAPAFKADASVAHDSLQSPAVGSTADTLTVWARLRRSASLGAGCAADIAMNYPLWVIAKRRGVGIVELPASFPELYKGGGSLWLSLGPTTIIGDVTKAKVEELLPPSPPAMLPVDKELLSSAVAGGFAAATFCAQIEHIITAAHAKNLRMASAFAHIYHQRGGLRGLLLPPGMLAMVGREIPFAAALFYIRPVVTKTIYGTQNSANVQDKPGDAWSNKRFHLECISGLLTSALTCPFSHVPSVIAAYQQGHGVDLRRACSDIYQQGGLRAFWRGLIARTLSIGGTMIVVPVVMDALGGE